MRFCISFITISNKSAFFVLSVLPTFDFGDSQFQRCSRSSWLQTAGALPSCPRPRPSSTTRWKQKRYGKNTVVEFPVWINQKYESQLVYAQCTFKVDIAFSAHANFMHAHVTSHMCMSACAWLSLMLLDYRFYCNVNSTTGKTLGQSCWDWRACKIGACIILIFLVAVGAFIAYVMYQKYCCWIKKPQKIPSITSVVGFWRHFA